MKKNDLVKLAAIGIAAGFCISGQTARNNYRELAMAKCSKPEKPENGDENGSEMDGNGDAHDEMMMPAGGNDADYQNDDTSQLGKQKAKPPALPAAKVKSAARKVIEGVGSSNTTIRVPRQSAAQKAIEAEARH